MATKIAWTDETWNPVVGCTPVSEGCRNCYAERMAMRQVGMENGNYWGTVSNTNGVRWTGQVNLVESALEKPLRWKEPRRIFLCSMGDLFHENVKEEWIYRVLDVIDRCPQHTFQVLTKRPKRAFVFTNMTRTGNPIHLYTSISNQRDWASYGKYVLYAKTVLRGISYEPALGPVDWDAILKKDSIGHVICGCESGPGARPMHLALAKAALDVCRKYEAPFFMKQIKINGKLVHDMAQFPADLRVQEMPDV